MQKSDIHGVPKALTGSGRWRTQRSGVKEERLAEGRAGDTRGAECAVGLIPPRCHVVLEQRQRSSGTTDRIGNNTLAPNFFDRPLLQPNFASGRLALSLNGISIVNDRQLN